jgi:hypothetical protein
MSPRTLTNPAAAPADAASRPTITPDLAAVLNDARPHPQLGEAAGAPAPNGARLGRAAAAIAADLALRPEADADLAGLLASYLLPAGTRARVHRTAPGGVLLLAPCAAPRTVAAAGPGLYVVVEASA